MSTRTAAVLLLALAASVVLTACGVRAHRAGRPGAAPAALARAVARADAACADLDDRRTAVRRLTARPRPPEVTARAYGALADMSVDAAEALDRVALPPGGGERAAALRRYVAAARRASAIAWRVRHALAAGELVEAQALVAAATRAQAPTRALAREAGLHTCGDRT